MDKEKSAVDDFLGDLGKEEVSFNQEEKTPEVKEEVVEPIEEDKIPFHKNPKVQRYIERQLDKRLKDFQPSRQEQFVQEVQEEDSLIDAFTTVIGNDTPEKVNALKALKRSMDERENRAADKAYARFAEDQKRAQEAESAAVEELSEGIERIEENFNVDMSSNSPAAKKTRNEFLDFVERISPKNADGEVVEYADLDQAFETFKEMRKPVLNNQAKEIAARGMSRSSASSNGQPAKRITFANVGEFIGLDT